MNCQEFWNTMPELTGGPDGPHEVHLRGCRACALLLERQKALAEGLREAAAEWSRLEAPERLERRLASAWRSHNGLADMRPRGRWRPIVTWVAAAAATIALALFLVRSREPQPLPRRASNGVELAFYQPENESFFDSSEFIPLPNAQQIGPQEQVNLVRVELPRASMMAVGFAVSAERADETVLADVVLDIAGQARAVRFVE